MELVFRIYTKDALDKLSKSLGVRLTKNTARLWYPEGRVEEQKKPKEKKKTSVATNDWTQEWVKMPDFEAQPDFYAVIKVTTTDIPRLSAAISKPIDSDKTKYLYFPQYETSYSNEHVWVSLSKLMPKYPIYIVSKGRWKQRKTALAFEKLKIPYYIVVEEHQYEQYANVIETKPFGKVLILPQRYLDDYETCDKLGNKKSKGPGAARNFAWDHSIKELGAKRHWVFDDNVRAFYRFHKGKKIKMDTPVFFRVMEDYVDRYENVAIAGLQNLNFLRPDSHKSPMIFNTRIYSMLLIQNDIPFRWRCRYNEDTDISLRVLKAGWCTIQFEIFSGHKEATQQDKGGNTEDFYKNEGTKAKSEMLQKMHPDVTKLVKRWGRDHHYVNYNPYRKNKLKRLKTTPSHTERQVGFKLVKKKK